MSFRKRLEQWLGIESDPAQQDRAIMCQKTREATYDLLWKVGRLMALDDSLSHYYLFELALMRSHRQGKEERDRIEHAYQEHAEKMLELVPSPHPHQPDLNAQRVLYHRMLVRVMCAVNFWLREEETKRSMPQQYQIMITPSLLRFFDVFRSYAPSTVVEHILQCKLWHLFDIEQMHVCITNVLYYGCNPVLLSVFNASEPFSIFWTALHHGQSLLFGAGTQYPGAASAPSSASTSSPLRGGSFGETPGQGKPMAGEERDQNRRRDLLVFFLIQLLAKEFPGKSLDTFSFQLNLVMDRLEFLDAVPERDFEILDILGVGGEGCVRRMRYNGKEYAIKTLPNIGAYKHEHPGRATEERDRFEYVTNLPKFTQTQKKDPYWCWLYRAVKEYVAMLVLPRPEYVRLFYCYTGSFPPLPSEVCGAPACRSYSVSPNGKCSECGSAMVPSSWHNNEVSSDEEIDCLHLVVELCDASLDRYLARNPTPKLSEDRVCRYLCQMLSGLAHYHARGMVHLDLKPANILLRREHDILCLADFGLASFSSFDPTHLGTALYNPPEVRGVFSTRGTDCLQGLPEGYNLSCIDVYGIGCIALQLLGATPHQIDGNWEPLEVLNGLNISSSMLKERIFQLLHPDWKHRISATRCLVDLEIERHIIQSVHRRQMLRVSRDAAIASLPPPPTPPVTDRDSDADADPDTPAFYDSGSSMNLESSTPGMALSWSMQLGEEGDLSTVAMCDACGKCPLQRYWGCVDCPSPPGFNLCWRCFEGHSHRLEHQFEEASDAVVKIDGFKWHRTAQVMERYGLFDFSEISLPAIESFTGNRQRDFIQGMGQCCHNFLTLISSKSKRMQSLASQHLIRIASHHLSVAVFLENGIILQLCSLLIEALKLKREQIQFNILLIVYTLLTQHSHRREVVIDLMNSYFLSVCLEAYRGTRSRLLRSLIEVLFIRSLRNGMLIHYYETHLAPSVCNMLFSTDIAICKFALTIMREVVLAYPAKSNMLFESILPRVCQLYRITTAACEQVKIFRASCVSWNSALEDIFTAKTFNPGGRGHARPLASLSEGSITDSHSSASARSSLGSRVSVEMTDDAGAYYWYSPPAIERAPPTLQDVLSVQSQREDVHRERRDPPQPNLSSVTQWLSGLGARKTASLTSVSRGSARPGDPFERATRSVSQRRPNAGNDGHLQTVSEGAADGMRQAASQSPPARGTFPFVSCNETNAMSDLFQIEGFYRSLVCGLEDFLHVDQVLRTCNSLALDIALFFCTAEFPISCSRCQRPVKQVLYHCELCAEMYLCESCFEARLVPPFWHTHDASHWMVMARHERQAHAGLFQNEMCSLQCDREVMKRILRGEALGSEQAQSSESLGHTHWFMSGHVRLRLCPKCKQTLAIHADGHRRCVCLGCDHEFCVTCRLTWKETEFLFQTEPRRRIDSRGIAALHGIDMPWPRVLERLDIFARVQAHCPLCFTSDELRPETTGSQCQCTELAMEDLIPRNANCFQCGITISDPHREWRRCPEYLCATCEEESSPPGGAEASVTGSPVRSVLPRRFQRSSQISGIVKKKSRVLKIWNVRWLVLTAHDLAWYPNRLSTAASGKILFSSPGVTVSAFADNQFPTRFVVFVEEVNEYSHFEVTSEVLRDQWVHHINSRVVASLVSMRKPQEHSPSPG